VTVAFIYLTLFINFIFTSIYIYGIDGIFVAYVENLSCPDILVVADVMADIALLL
jgi:hypothetical protein